MGRGDDAAVWEVTRPARPGVVAGVTIAGFRRGASGAEHRLVPHAVVTLSVDFGAEPVIVDDATGVRRRGSLAVGLGFGGAVWVRGANIECVHVRLSPLAARAVLGFDPADLAGGIVALDDLWGRDAARLGERLSATAAWQDRFAVIGGWLARRHEAGAPVEPEVAWAWRRMVAGRGQVRVDRLAAELGWSRKRLWSRFHAQIGLPPKRAAKLVRFDHAAHRLAEGQDPAQVAAESGYTDQSHLHRDIAALAGTTPAALARESREATAALTTPGQEGTLLAPAWAMCTPGPGAAAVRGGTPR
ncbi:helix-turn-helix domain-containing protein [Amycolatopsis ruanii]|uniref:helix-turn-helix domain-containing protein n=1 Tax=Amycolatopsis ruanii TaxID=944491 RepID=UPI001966FFA8|nr:helix-turn-helix domain-containing protein [Amycolatopsis ruanii]